MVKKDYFLRMAENFSTEEREDIFGVLRGHSCHPTVDSQQKVSFRNEAEILRGRPPPRTAGSPGGRQAAARAATATRGSVTETFRPLEQTGRPPGQRAGPSCSVPAVCGSRSGCVGGLGGIELDQITRERPGPVQVGPRGGGAWGLAGERREALPGGTPRDAAGRRRRSGRAPWVAAAET